MKTADFHAEAKKAAERWVKAERTHARRPNLRTERRRVETRIRFDSCLADLVEHKS